MLRIVLRGKVSHSVVCAVSFFAEMGKSYGGKAKSGGQKGVHRAGGKRGGFVPASGSGGSVPARRGSGGSVPARVRIGNRPALSEVWRASSAHAPLRWPISAFGPGKFQQLRVDALKDGIKIACLRERPGVLFMRWIICAVHGDSCVVFYIFKAKMYSALSPRHAHVRRTVGAQWA